MNTIKKMLPHLCILFAGMFITFFVIDQFNSAMSVIGNNTLAKTLLLLFSVTAVVVSGMLIRRQRSDR
jgi:heme/copper-type cytochrome/quinol oxidase subunit 3